MAIVNTNFNSVFSTVQLNRVSRALSQATVRISSGQKLNYAGDDIVGVGSAAQFKAQIGGMDTAQTNAGDVESLMRVADSALEQITSYLLDMRDIALRAANDATLTPADLANLDTEYQALMSDAQNVAANTEYNNINLLDGTYGNRTAQIGPNSTQSISINNMPDADAEMTGAIAGTDVTSAANAATALTEVDNTLDFLASAQAQIGTYEVEMGSALTGLGHQEVNMSAALSNVVDADMASEIAQFARLQILSDSGSAVLAQANYVTERIISILDKL